MQATVLAVFMMVVLASTAIRGTTAQGDTQCRHIYTRQPPVASAIMCNPYTINSQLTLKCELQIPEEDLNGADIQWFNGTEQIINGNVNGPTTFVENTTVSSTLTLSGDDVFTSSQKNFSCLLVLGDNNWLPSDNLLLDPESEYMSYFQCMVNNHYSKTDQKCAVGSSSPPATAAPTSSISPTTESTTSQAPNNPPMTTSSLSLHTPPTSTPSPSPITSHTTLTSTDQPLTTTGGGNNGGDSSQPGTLEVWIYVLVAVAAVFAIIIVILAIMCVGLCVRRSKTIDTNSLKQNGQPEQFTPSNTMVTNDMYNRCDMTLPSQFTSHSQISDYNTLGERDYEVVKSVFDTKEQEYHRLQRPSPPNVPNGRTGGMFGSPPGKEFQSMSTLTSQLGNGSSMQMFPRGNGMRTASTLPLPPTPNKTEPPHVYGELEEMGSKPSFSGNIYRSPTNSSPPDSARWCDSATELLPPGSGCFRVSSNSFDEVDHEALYSQVNDPLSTASVNPMFVHALQDIPETGPVFKDPLNPTAFPVNEYDVIPAKKYETPVSSKHKPGENPKTRVSVKSLNYETDPNLDTNTDDTDTNKNKNQKFKTASFSQSSVPADSKVSTMTSIVSDDTTDFTGASEVGFAVGMPDNDIFSSSTGVLGSSSMDDYRNPASSINFLPTEDSDNICDASTTSGTMSSSTTNTLPDNSELGSSKTNHYHSLSSSASDTRVKNPTNHHTTHTATSHMEHPHRVSVSSSNQLDLNPRSTSLPPLSVPVNHHNRYRDLNVSGLEPHLQYARLQIGITSTV